jgi:hypothetical protein
VAADLQLFEPTPGSLSAASPILPEIGSPRPS